MIAGTTVSLVMPCRNEAAHLADAIAELPAFFDEVICVSNKSSDDTVRVGRELEKRYNNFRLLIDDRTAGGIGYGFAHMTGVANATCEIVVCADSDCTYPVDDIPRILDSMKERGLLFASCTRYPDHTIPYTLQLGVKFLNLEMLLLYGFSIHDSLSGMWVFRRDVFSKLHLTEGDWNLSPQIKLNAHKYLRSRFGEVKISQRMRRGETKQNYIKTGLHHLLWIARNRFSARKGIQPAD